MLNSGTNFALCATKKKNSNSRVVWKKNSERKKKPVTPCKLNGRSLSSIWVTEQLEYQTKIELIVNKKID